MKKYSPKDLIKSQEDYIKLLEDEINDLAPFGYSHGWKTSRYKRGVELRRKIEIIKSFIEEKK